MQRLISITNTEMHCLMKMHFYVHCLTSNMNNERQFHPCLHLQRCTRETLHAQLYGDHTPDLHNSACASDHKRWYAPVITFSMMGKTSEFIKVYTILLLPLLHLRSFIHIDVWAFGYKKSTNTPWRLTMRKHVIKTLKQIFQWTMSFANF